MSAHGVLLIGADHSLFRQVNDICGERCVVCRCKDTEEALAALDTGTDVSVVILDVVFEREEIAGFLLTMRRQYPKIPTIALSKIGETTVIIDLVEQSLVYRYLPKPVKTALLRLGIAAALAHKRIDMVGTAPQIPGEAINELSPLSRFAHRRSHA